MTAIQMLITVGVATLATVLTRFFPFWLFSGQKQPPAYVAYLGNMLPPAVIGLLVVYCLKAVQPASYPYGIPEALALLVVVGLHFYKHNTLLSIGGGTVAYMVLIQLFSG